jgi:MFS transporter, OFA family, oxalate/formate antiporter
VFSSFKNKIRYLSSPGFVRRWPVYYGWVVLAAGSLGLVMTSPGQTYTVSIFIEHFIQDLNLSRSAVSTLYSLGTLAGGLTLPLWGRQIDQRGARRMVVFIALIFGLALVYMGTVQNALMLGIGFVAIRMLGQGSLGLVSQTVMNQWWSRRRGMIVGISGVILSALGLAAFPNLVYRLIEGFGWRMRYPILGALLIFGMAPLGYLLYRNRPEDYGLRPDNEALEAEPEDLEPSLPDRAGPDWTLKEALRTRVFWLLLASLASFTMLGTGQLFHLVSIFEDRGLPPAVAASVFVPLALATAAANLTVGIAIDRLPVKYFLAAGLTFQALSLLMIQFISSPGSAYVFGLLLGATSGMFHATSAVVWPTFYGRTHLGSIYGFTSAAGVLGAALGPVPFGITRDMLGSYQLILTLAVGLSVALGVLSFTVRKPHKAAPAEPFQKP